MIILKPGVSVKKCNTQIILAAMVADRIYDSHGKTLVITSCSDGIHSDNSLHYSGNAIDLRIRDIEDTVLANILKELKDYLGSEYDVILENDHFHIEYDPKT